MASTELAYEKANRLGLKLNQSRPDNPPAAPVRPYLSQKAAPPPAGRVDAEGAISRSAPEADLAGRIRSAVISKMGSQVDPALLDVIIQRVLKSTGIK